MWCVPGVGFGAADLTCCTGRRCCGFGGCTVLGYGRVFVCLSRLLGRSPPVLLPPSTQSRCCRLLALGFWLEFAPPYCRQLVPESYGPPISPVLLPLGSAPCGSPFGVGRGDSTLRGAGGLFDLSPQGVSTGLCGGVYGSSATRSIGTTKTSWIWTLR